MRKVCAIAAAFAMLAFAMPVLADAPTPVGVSSVPNGTPLNTMHVQQGAERTGKVLTYLSMTYASYYFPAGANFAVADDLGLAKDDPRKALMNRFSFAYFCPQGPVQGCGDAKIDFYDSVGGAYLPSTLTKFATYTVTDLPKGAYIITVDIDPIEKPNLIWASIQFSDGRAGLLIDDFLPTVGFDWAGVAFGTSIFALNPQKDNNAGWNLYYFGGAPPANFFWAIWNSPEPTTMVLLAGGVAALLRKRR